MDRAVRGMHLGRRVLDQLVQAAQERGNTRVVLHAQLHAQQFYRQAGFSAFGEPDEEAGIAHIMMGRDL